ncbi:Anaerobic nitric oxide reductase transcription regulator NorR [Sutcliffiella rhizosphaerae]|uniref:Anaerobic nitric oxide reductase transcription regulator NorR n=1 Tax=Sutcliffiella rhizosphaerae TaxID=2880967 RepID=A0ABM8YTN9_9BACI|nr:Anaerobic nitric oxide reductase transcription regulator NorR [Sutcliffiella rhizosphaerae]
MIAIYKLEKSLVDKISILLLEYHISPTYFSSISALSKQSEKPLIIIAPLAYKKELECLSIPILPLTIHLEDVEKRIERNEEKLYFMGSDEEIRSLSGELKLKNIHCNMMLININEMQNNSGVSYLLPIWYKEDHLHTQSVYYVEPSLSTLSSIVNQAVTLLDSIEKLLHKKFEVEAIVTSSHDGIVAVDKQGTITLVNDIAKTMLGFEGQKMVGRKINDYIPHSDMLRILETGKSEQGDFTILQDKQVVVNRRPVLLNDKTVGAVSTIKYFSNIKSVELKLRKMLHQSGLEAKYSLGSIIGKSRSITRVKEQAKVFALTDATVLITGKSGTGKELFAQGIHLESNRKHGPFVAVNCAALPESLLESELFGYEEGSFTGAKKGGKAGLFEQAHGGTLFLDEIGEMPPRIQALLLRILQEKTVRRIGGERVTPIDVRILTATNRDLEEEMDSGNFREDLYYRINVLLLEIPPLQDRKEDIPPLVQHMVHQLNEKKEKKIEEVGEEVYSALMEHHWPGNIRELRNVVERMVLLENGSRLSRSNLLLPKKRMVVGSQDVTIKESEKDTIRFTLEKYQFNKTKTAKYLGIDRSTLWRKIREYNL